MAETDTDTDTEALTYSPTCGEVPSAGEGRVGVAAGAAAGLIVVATKPSHVCVYVQFVQDCGGKTIHLTQIRWENSVFWN